VSYQSEQILPPPRAPWRNMMILFGLILLGMSVGNALSLIVVFVISSFQSTISVDDIGNLLQNPAQVPHAWGYIMTMQLVAHVFTFLVPSLIYWRWVENRKLRDFVYKPRPAFLLFLITLAIVLTSMPFMSLMIELNKGMKLPSNLKVIEDWMSSQEKTIERMTVFLTDFSSWPKLIVAFFVIAVVPAIGEECLFRGLIQRKIFNKTQNMHVGIWVAAAIFSAIHLQFYGFLPRMLLGAAFGYLYWWSSNLWIPIFAHLVQNGSTIIALFLNNRKIIDFDLEKSDSSVSVVGGLISLLLTAMLLYYFKKNTGNTSSTVETESANWSKVFESPHQHQAQIIHDYLIEKNIQSVILNKKDSNYHWGRYELFVNPNDSEIVKNIIENDISFK
jgi:membrane protease YdiL (CAAX protease family)